MRLIDADALCDKCKEAKCDYLGCKEPGNCAAAEMPTIDAVPVRHGRWIKLDGAWKSMDTGAQVTMHQASCCGRYFMHAPYDYCPGCGAKMDDEKAGE